MRRPLVVLAVLLCGCPPAQTGQARTRADVDQDQKIKAALYAMLLEDRVLRKRHTDIVIEVRNGVVVLTGRVGSEEEKQRAQSLAEVLGDVRRIENLLEVKPDPR